MPMPRAIITFFIPAPSNAAIRRASKSMGKAKRASMNRMMIWYNAPPKKAAIRPRVKPMIDDMPIAEIPTINDVREP